MSQQPIFKSNVVSSSLDRYADRYIHVHMSTNSPHDFIIGIDCGIPPTIDHATLIVSTTSSKSKAKYACDEGYTNELTSIERTCLSDGTWSVGPLFCKGSIFLV